MLNLDYRNLSLRRISHLLGPGIISSLSHEVEGELLSTWLLIQRFYPCHFRDDPELDQMMKERVRWGDPMAHLVKVLIVLLPTTKFTTDQDPPLNKKTNISADLYIAEKAVRGTSYGSWRQRGDEKIWICNTTKYPKAQLDNKRIRSCT